MTGPRTIAFYLPQFHRIPENDRWWGEGFTEWTNVRRAHPLFDGHDHPRRPTELGEYDLTNHAVMVQQSELAREHDIDGFCIYFYWFEDGRRLLERPVEAWRKDESLLPYMLCWANEPWTRRWDGKNQDVLMPQTYPENFEQRLFEDLLPHLRAPHYIRHQGRPVLLVHRVDAIKDGRKFSERLAAMAAEAGLPGLHLVAAETKPGLDPRSYGFNAAVEFPPVGRNVLRFAQFRSLGPLQKGFTGRILSYDKVAAFYMRRRSPNRYVRYPGVMPGWDNTARRQLSATIYVGSSPERYGEWLQVARAREEARRGTDGLVYINAWNEWAEGAYLEPDASHGRSYLEASRRNSESLPTQGRLDDKSGTARPSTGQVMSWTRLAASSLLAAARQARNRIRSS